MNQTDPSEPPHRYQIIVLFTKPFFILYFTIIIRPKIIFPISITIIYHFNFFVYKKYFNNIHYYLPFFLLWNLYNLSLLLLLLLL